MKAALVLTASGVAYAVTAHLESEMAGINAFATFFIATQLNMSNKSAYAHGINGGRHVLSMPIGLFIKYLVVLIAFMLLAFSSLSNENGLSVAATFRLHLCAFSGLLGWLAALIYWYAFSYRETYYLSESYERELLKMNGTNDARIEDVIAHDKRKGLFGPSAQQKE
ncbi:MAG: hypothetical protein ABSE76_02460 [Minisyncoccia bacterium]